MANFLPPSLPPSLHPSLLSSLPPSFLPSLQVKAEADVEQAQSITETKKQAVHEELLRKATAKEVGSDLWFGIGV